jgi:hypothetical protein
LPLPQERVARERERERERNEEVAWSNGHIFASSAAAMMQLAVLCILMRYKPKCAGRVSKWDDDGLAADGYF